MIVLIGNTPAVENGAAIYELLPDGSLTFLYEMQEQGGHDVHYHSDGSVVVAGTDPTGSWDFGNVYVKEQDSSFELRRTIANNVHVWGATEDSGRLVVAGGVNNEGVGSTGLHISEDLGLTWEPISNRPTATSTRFYDVTSFNGRIYASVEYNNNWQTMNLWWTSDDGDTWTMFDSFVPRPRHRHVVFKGSLYVVDNDLSTIHKIDSGHNHTVIDDFPTNLTNNYNTIAKHGDYMYVLGGSQDNQIWKYDSVDWVMHHESDTNSYMSLFNLDNDSLVAFTKGTDSTIYSINF